jgi:hypothetical protein
VIIKKNSIKKYAVFGGKSRNFVLDTENFFLGFALELDSERVPWEVWR